MLKHGLALALLLSACGSESGSGASPTSSKDGGSAGADRCSPAKRNQSCYCEDGLRSGSQTCGADGEWSACACDVDLSANQKPTASNGGLCADLASQSGCEAKAYVSTELPSSMLFVLDRSRSMVCNLPPLQSSEDCEANPQPVDRLQASKWGITREALANTFEELPSGAELGLAYFSNNGSCGVSSQPAVGLNELDDSQRMALVDSLNTMQPDGLTPIVGATILAYHYLHEVVKAPGNRFVVLITDGAESCAPESIGQLLDDEVRKARDANIRTFVIGAPGSENARALLSELAYRGGTAASAGCVHDIKGAADKGNCHLDMTTLSDFAAALASALGTVSSAAQSCEFAVPASGDDDKTNVNVQLTPGGGGTPTCFQQVAGDCASADGWQFAKGPDGSVDYDKVVLCGSACDAIRNDAAARVDILVGCRAIIAF